MTPLEILLQNYPQLVDCKSEIEKSSQIIIDCQEKGGTLFTCGNGGSCADADHISGELLKGFCTLTRQSNLNGMKIRILWRI